MQYSYSLISATQILQVLVYTVKYESYAVI